MIRYTKGAFQTLLYWWGGINRHLILNSVLYLLFLVALFWAQSKWPIFRVESSTSGLSMLGSLTVFLLVFRMNQSMARNNEATERTDEMFGELDFLIHSVCSFMQGAKEDCLHDLVLNPHRVHSEEEIRIMKLHGELASMVRIHVVRLTIAFGVSCLLYFRILTALADAQGVLEEEDLVQIVFLHSRLQALLYEEEMELVDQYMGISRETDGAAGSEAEYRAETGRFRIAAQCSGLLMRPRKAGNNEEEDCCFVPQSSDIIPPLPKVILSMLVETCHTPLAQKWGYPERVLNLIASISADALDQLTHLSGLIARPVSLAYYQHCRVIVVIFSFMLPLVTEVGEDRRQSPGRVLGLFDLSGFGSKRFPNVAGSQRRQVLKIFRVRGDFGEDLLGSIFDNIVFPFVIYWAAGPRMFSGKWLAEMMENPVGDDDTDINLLQQLHELEVGAQLAIELCENRRSMLRRTLAKVCPSCSETSKFWKNKPPLVPPIHFEDYFCWLPIPAAIAEGMVMKHGHVDHVHWAFFEGHIAEFRTFLRKALRRHTPGRRSAYEAIPQDASAEELKVYPEAEMDSTMGMIQRDTNQFWHYLAFRPVLSGIQAQGELSRQDRRLFPDAYKSEMAFGTYRPGVYFGIKGRHAGSFLLGLAWGSMDGKTLRHECESGELQSFNWLEHDGRNYGRQIIEDQKLQAKLQTTFVKEGHQKLHARVDVETLSSSNGSNGSNSSSTRPMSLFLYLGVESGEHRLEVVSQDSEWEACGDFSCRSLVLAGTDPSGPFRARLSFRARKARFHQLSSRVPHEVESSEEDPPLTGVWDARKHFQEHFKRVSINASKGTKTIRVLPDSEARDANFAAFQLAGPLAGLRIDAHVAFGSADLGARDAESLRLAELAKRSSEAFKTHVAEVFLKPKGAKESELKAEAFEGVAVALSSLLGGLGSFRGRLLARTEEGEKPVRLRSSVLFSGVPSRSFFPRGFLWDEGFHGLLLARWQPRIFLEVLGHWLELQQENGWIPREVPLGAEQERRVPKQFLTQDSKVANPPSFLLPLSWLLSVEDEKLAKQAGLSKKELRDLVLSFSAQALPRLGAWFAFLERSQKSSHPSKCFRWQGRTAAHCLASGLDDYPRGLLVNEDECHLDLQSWMALFARTLARLCQHLAEGEGSSALSKEANSAWCVVPRWSERAAALNASLFEVFVDPKAPKNAPLADFLGLQPVERSGKVRVLPPWRSDGRCGPQFPVAGSPGECDPYGGAPCCSPSGWCGGSPDFCECPGCRRFAKLEERSQTTAMAFAKAFSPHLGYVSLFPLLLGHQPCDHPRAAKLLKALAPKTGELWSPFGVRSLSRKDPLNRQGEDYWRGKIWANLNYLSLSALQRCSRELPEARDAFDSLKKGFVGVVLKALQEQRFLMENFDPDTGKGTGAAPFAGWTALVALVLADLPFTDLGSPLPDSHRDDL
ncbi:GCS1 [Symbiodinium sp. CCMP2592]|nr:GCS1 [Symbiodinium sp. CCMP2592]